MFYKNLHIHFLSGTGNTVRVASWMKELAETEGLSVKLSSITHLKPSDTDKDEETTLVGIGSPTHGFTAPWSVLRYAVRLPRKRKAHAFCFSTRAGLKFGPVFIPGLSATVFFVLALLLFFKGYRIKGMMSFDMPCNWIALHSGLKPSNSEAIVQRAKPKVMDFFARILHGQPRFFTRNLVYEFFGAVLLWPISILYLLIGRFFLAKLFFTNPNCNGCGICVQECPVHAVQFWGWLQKKPFWNYNCESCMHCMAFCPQQAIEASHPWAIVLYLLTAGSISVSILNALINWSAKWLPAIFWINPFSRLFYIYLVLFLAYYVFILLNRIPVVNRWLMYTTPTHYYRRYREPSAALSHFTKTVTDPIRKNRE